MADSTTKDDPITPGLHRASEAESTLGSHVSELVGEVVIGTSKPIASLVQPSPVGKRMRSTQEDPTSPMVMPSPRQKNATPRKEIAMPKRTRSTPKSLGTDPLDVSGSPLDVPLNHFMKKKKSTKQKLYSSHRSRHLEEAK